MTRSTRLLASASVLAAAAFGAAPALAAGTQAGSTITNTVTLNYQVGGVNQNSVSASDSFTVDRKVNLTVAEDGNTTTSVSPGQATAVTAFTVTNTSNAPLDFALAAAQLAGGSAAHGGTDNFDVSNVRIYRDANDNGSYDGGDELITYLDQVAADDSERVFVLADVPLGRATSDVAAVRLTATAAEATAAGSVGATITQTSGANTSGVDTVFADTDADSNIARDGAGFAIDDYTVLAATLTVTKTSRIISDPLNNGTNPKAIPGAVVEYCMLISNAAGSATATAVSVSDVLPSATAYLNDAANADYLGIRVDGVDCNAAGNAGGSYTDATRTVAATLADIAGGTARAVRFRVTVN